MIFPRKIFIVNQIHKTPMQNKKCKSANQKTKTYKAISHHIYANKMQIIQCSFKEIFNFYIISYNPFLSEIRISEVIIFIEEKLIIAASKWFICTKNLKWPQRFFLFFGAYQSLFMFSKSYQTWIIFLKILQLPRKHLMICRKNR